jgi:N-carbamoylputrescine amidase
MNEPFRRRIAMLHLAPRLGALGDNYRCLAAAMRAAKHAGADWVATSELCLCGYRFADRIGTSWIVPWPDNWGEKVCGLAASLRLTVFLAHVERDSGTNRLHNTVFVIGTDGSTIGSQRKTHLIPQSEAWASRGARVAPVEIAGCRAGILVCADAYTPGLAQRLSEQGADILISPAAWGPRLHGPRGEWEARSRETRLPLFVCNRVGTKEEPDFVDAESVIVNAGERIMTYASSEPAVLVADWQPSSGAVYPLPSVGCQGFALEDRRRHQTS